VIDRPPLSSPASITSPRSILAPRYLKPTGVISVSRPWARATRSIRLLVVIDLTTVPVIPLDSTRYSRRRGRKSCGETKSPFSSTKPNRSASPSVATPSEAPLETTCRARSDVPLSPGSGCCRPANSGSLTAFITRTAAPSSTRIRSRIPDPAPEKAS